jgi:hypothetical protein
MRRGGAIAFCSVAHWRWRWVSGPRGELGVASSKNGLESGGIRLRLGAIYRCQRSDQNLVMLRLGSTLSGHTDELIDQPRYSLRTP